MLRRKPTRGGGRHFTPQRILSGRDETEGQWRDREDREDDESEDESSEESGSEEEEEEQDELAAPPSRDAQPSTSALRDGSKKEARAVSFGTTPNGRGAGGTATDPGAAEEDSGDEALREMVGKSKTGKDLAKPVKLSNLSVSGSQPMSRREREAAEKKAAAERYRKLHEAGKTDEARADLARLKKIREERAKAAAETAAKKSEKAKLQEQARLGSQRKR